MQSNDTQLLPVGTVLNHGAYKIDDYLASGGFGNTYVATDQRFGERVAIKEFFMRGVSMRTAQNPTVSISITDNRQLFDEQMQKFKKEAQRLHRLHSEHIVQVTDLFDENGTTYYVMEFVDGDSAEGLLKKGGAPIAEATALNYLSQTLDALLTVHSQGLWHLDIKPQNIMVNKQGVVKLIDFGASKQLKAGGGATTSTGLSLTPGYAPREQVEQNYSKFGPWTDIYALGATLYRMVTNQKPPMPSDIDDDGEEAFTFPPSLSPSTRQLILWMMQPNRNKRPQTVAEVKQWLATNGAIPQQPQQPQYQQPQQPQPPMPFQQPAAPQPQYQPQPQPMPSPSPIMGVWEGLAPESVTTAMAQAWGPGAHVDVRDRRCYEQGLFKTETTLSVAMPQFNFPGYSISVWINVTNFIIGRFQVQQGTDIVYDNDTLERSPFVLTHFQVIDNMSGNDVTDYFITTIGQNMIDWCIGLGNAPQPLPSDQIQATGPEGLELTDADGVTIHYQPADVPTMRSDSPDYRNSITLTEGAQKCYAYYNSVHPQEGTV